MMPTDGTANPRMKSAISSLIRGFAVPSVGTLPFMTDQFRFAVLGIRVESVLVQLFAERVAVQSQGARGGGALAALLI